jgi:hypothetical protein
MELAMQRMVLRMEVAIERVWRERICIAWIGVGQMERAMRQRMVELQMERAIELV